MMATLTVIVLGSYFTQGTIQVRAAQISQAGQLDTGGNVNQVAWSPDKKWIAVASSEIQIYDSQTLKLNYSFSINYENYVSSPLGLAFSPDSRLLVASTTDGFFVYNVDGWSRVFYKVDLGIQWGPQTIAFSPDGTLLAVSAGSAVQLWNVESWTVSSTLPGTSGYAVAFSSDEKTLAAAGGTAGEDIKVWDYKSGKELNALTGHTNWIYSIAFSPDGKILASGSADEKIWLWNMTTGLQLRVLAGHTNSVNCVAFSPNGQFLASGSRDLTVKLWNVFTGQELASLTGHTGPVQGVAFSIAGETLASCGWDNTVLLWNTSSLITNSTPTKSPADTSPSTSVPIPTSTSTTVFGINPYETLTIVVAIIAGIMIPMISIYIALSPQDIVFKFVRRDSVVDKPIKSRIALEVSHPDKPIKKCRIIYNNMELVTDENLNHKWATVLAQGTALFRIPLNMEDEDAKIVVKNGRRTIEKTKLKEIQTPLKLDKQLDF
jgi:WD40 repeat protein